jgi:hypothetical protein
MGSLIKRAPRLILPASEHAKPLVISRTRAMEAHYFGFNGMAADPNRRCDAAQVVFKSRDRRPARVPECLSGNAARRPCGRPAREAAIEIRRPDELWHALRLMVN